MGRLSGVLLTHFHSDTYPRWARCIWQLGARASEQAGCLWGPGINQVVDGFNMAYGLDYGYRVAHHGMDVLPPAHADCGHAPLMRLKPARLQFMKRRAENFRFTVPTRPLHRPMAIALTIGAGRW